MSDQYQRCRCCGFDVLPFVAGSYPSEGLCDDCGRGKCDDCIEEVRRLWAEHTIPDAAQLTVRVEPTAAQRNPEQDVLDSIDALVDEQLAEGPTDDYHKPYQEKCPQCRGSWHGLRRGDCPGATGIEGRPQEGAKRDTDVFARDINTDADREFLTRFAANMERFERAMAWLTSDHHNRPPHGDRERFPSTLNFVGVPPMEATFVADTEPMPPQSISTDIITVNCGADPSDQYPNAWEFKVYVHVNGRTELRSMAITREFLNACRPTVMAVMPLPVLGEAKLLVLQGGTVVLDVPAPSGGGVHRMGFLGAGGRP